MPAKQARSVCFTLNNPEDGEVVITALQSCTWVKYGIVGREVGESGTPHLQGYLNLVKRTSLKKITKMLTEVCGKAPHTETCKGTPAQNIEYCSKDKNFTEWGDRPKMGARTDIANFLDAFKKARTVEDELQIADEMPVQYAKYYKAGLRVKTIAQAVEARAQRKEMFSDAKLRPWQVRMEKHLLEQGNRKVTWLVDPVGGQGKSWFAEYLSSKYDAFIVQGGKVADIAHAFQLEGIVVFDLTRQRPERAEYIYSIIECFKNGRLFSPKYDSGVKVFCPCKVLVCSNWAPDLEKLSADRWDIWNMPKDFDTPWTIAERGAMQRQREAAYERSRAASAMDVDMVDPDQFIFPEDVSMGDC